MSDKNKFLFKIFIFISVLSLLWFSTARAELNNSSLELNEGVVFVPYENQNGLIFTTNFAFEWWAKFDILPLNGEKQVFFARYNNDDGEGSYISYLENVSGTYRWYFCIENDSQFDFTSPTCQYTTLTDLETDVWHHYSINYFLSTHRAYWFYDSDLMKNSNTFLATSIYDAYADFSIGAWRSYYGGIENVFKGKIDEFRIWTTYIGGQIPTFMYSVLYGTEDNLLSYYKFDSDFSDFLNANNLYSSGPYVFNSTDIPFQGTFEVYYQDFLTHLSIKFSEVGPFWFIFDTSLVLGFLYILTRLLFKFLRQIWTLF